MCAYIYTITSPDNSEVYVGSTVQQPHIRWGKHRYDYDATVDGKRKSGCTSGRLFERYGFYACIFKVIEQTTIEERKARERYWIDTVATVNYQRPTLNDADLKQKIKERSRKYAEEHKEQISDYFKAYYGRTIPIRKQKFKEWYDTVGKQEVVCECGQSYKNGNKSRHLKSKHHTDYLSSK